MKIPLPDALECFFQGLDLDQRNEFLEKFPRFRASDRTYKEMEAMEDWLMRTIADLGNVYYLYH